MTKSTDLAPVVALWRGLKRDLFNPYRPELHYMRGPGPKWREKWAQGGHIGTQVR
jgi:hypothetical protein